MLAGGKAVEGGGVVEMVGQNNKGGVDVVEDLAVVGFDEGLIVDKLGHGLGPFAVGHRRQR